MYTSCLHIRLNISTKCYEDTTITCEVMAHKLQKSLKFDLWPLIVTLTFDIESWLLYIPQILNMLNKYTKLYENTTVTFEVTPVTRSDVEKKIYKGK